MTLSAAPNAPPASTVVDVIASPRGPSAGTQPHRVPVYIGVARAASGFDIRVKGIEVTQGIQPSGFLVPSGRFGDGDTYRGVSLATYGKTIVRAYADVTSGPPTGVRGVGIALRGYRGGRELPDSPILPIDQPAALTTLPFDGVGAAERQSVGGAYTYVLPRNWALGQIDLRAEALPPPAPVFPGDNRYEECTEPACAQNNRITLREIPFTPTRGLVVDALELKTASIIRRWSDVNEVFKVPRAVMPTGEGQFVVRGPRAVIENRDTDLNKPVSEWYHYNGQPGDAAIGVDISNGSGQSWINDHTGIANGNRPYTALSHELFHLVSALHASSCNGGGDPTKNQEGMVYDSWPPDQKGYLQALALDRSDGSGGSNGPFRFVTAGNPQPEAYDFMSYCAVKPGGLGVDLCVQLGEGPQLPAVRPPRIASGPRQACEWRCAAGDGHGRRPADARRRTGGRTAKDRAPTPYHAIARDSAGAVVGDVVLTGDTVHTEGAPSQLLLTAYVPARRAARVDLVLDGAVLASKQASAHVPRVRLLAPRPRARLRGTGGMTVRWLATDADGDRLTERVEYSTNGGRSWNMIGSTADRRAMALPAGLFSRSSRARVRVTATAGFHVATAVSGLLTAAGRPPQVTITDPRGGMRVPSDASLHLSGVAFDDRFATLRGRALSWYDGARLLGHGAQFTASGALAPGRRRLRLVARDRFGRAAARSVVIRVLPSTPRVVFLRAPRRIGRRARVVAMRLATAGPVTVSLGRARFAAGRRPRRLLIPVRPGARALTLPLLLRSGSAHARVTVRVAR